MKMGLIPKSQYRICPICYREEVGEEKVEIVVFGEKLVKETVKYCYNCGTIIPLKIWNRIREKGG